MRGTVQRMKSRTKRRVGDVDDNRPLRRRSHRGGAGDNTSGFMGTVKSLFGTVTRRLPR